MLLRVQKCETRVAHPANPACACPAPHPWQCELIDLVAAAELNSSFAAAAAILVIRNGARFACPPPPSSPNGSADALFHEQLQLQWDTRALMRGRVVNKRARHNVCYGEVAQQPHYEAG